jgi:hypothetical protein
LATFYVTYFSPISPGVSLFLLIFLFSIYNFICLFEGRDSSVGIATGYGLNGPGIEFKIEGSLPTEAVGFFPAGEIHSMQYDTIQTTIESPIPEQ